MTAKYSLFGGIRDALSEIMHHPATMATMPAVAGMAVGAGSNIVDRIRETRAKAQSYQGMMELHPQLQKADQKQVKRYFGTLARFNPMMAKDPTVSGAWISNIIDNETELDSGGQALLKGVQELAGIRNHLSGAIDRERGRGTGLGKTVQDVGNQAVSAISTYDRDQWQTRLQDAQLKTKAYQGAAKAKFDPDNMAGYRDHLQDVSDRAQRLREEAEERRARA